jgi:Pro-kumamolisin, activation domain/Viral BACON domain
MNLAVNEIRAVVRPVTAVLFAAAWLSIGMGLGRAAGPQVLSGHVPGAVREMSLRPAGRVPSTNRLELAINLPLRNTNELAQLLESLYNPASPHFHQFLTPEEFAARFGPTETDYAAVMAYARSNGLAVRGIHPNRTLVDVSGAVADIERALHVTLRVYRHPREPRNFYAPDTEPSPDLEVRLSGIRGLDDYDLPRPALGAEAVPSPGAGSASGGGYMGQDFRAAYAPDVALTGVGQSVALVQFDGFYQADITAYENSNNLPNIPIQTVLVDGFSGTPTPGSNVRNLEVSLDIEMAISMAPGLAQVLVYESPSTQAAAADMINRIATDNAAKQISCSWGNFTLSDSVLQQMAAQGQSFFVASGDSGAGVHNPADSAYVTSVGGTTLTTAGPAGARTAETAWNQGDGTATGGGVSATYALPYWQTNMNLTLNHGSATMRNFPDVAMVAANVQAMYDNGGMNVPAYGTSCASPLWAGFMALVNEQAATRGLSPVGFLNPALYALGRGGSYASVFNDITTGSNTNSTSPTNYFAVAGYDLCTGWGSPTGQRLINALTGTPDPLQILPATGFYAQTGSGLAISPNPVLTLTNNSGAALRWALVNTSAWLNVSAAGGLLASGAMTNVTVGVNTGIASLAAGTCTAYLTVSNLATGTAQLRSFTLRVAPVVANGGFETGDLTGWTLAGNTQVGTVLYDGVVVPGAGYGNFTHSGIYGMALGDTNLAYLSQTLATVAGQGYLLSFWLKSSTNQPVQQFLVNWNPAAAVTNPIYSNTFATTLAWTNLQFLVSATGTNSVLQFGARNDVGFFGLDDVSVTPIPAAVFQGLARSNNAIQLSWSAAGGLVYQLQMRTNLTLGGWANIGGPVSSTNLSLSAADTNVMPAGSQRFYRLLLAP